MIQLASGHYPQLTTFNEPWKFYVVDDFLPSNIISELAKLKNKEDRYAFIDQWVDGKDVIAECYGSFPKKKIIRLDSNSTTVKTITNCVVQKTKPLLPPSFVVTSELVRCDPGYNYSRHKDNKIKLVTIVVFLGPQKSCGTILYDDQLNNYVVGWKTNRALIFKNSEHGYHSYFNSTNKYRFTLNVFITEHGALFKVENL